MRSIGKKNIKLVEQATREVDESGNLANWAIEDVVIGRLPPEMWDTWEMADQEIRRIIYDTLMKQKK